MSKQQKQKYAIDPELLPYCRTMPQLPKWLTPLLQNGLRQYDKKLFKDARVDVTSFSLENGVTLHRIRPKGSITQKVVYDIHGGGFVFPHAPYHIELAKEYALRLDANVFIIEYRLAPEYQYPLALEDCFTGFEYLYRHKDELSIDIQNIIIGGDSAGGFLAVTTTLKMYAKYGFVPKGNFLLYPALDTHKDTESMRKFTDTPLCNSRDAEVYDAWFNNGEAVTVLNEDLSVMPETYMEVAEFDCLRDGGIAYANRLKALGIDVEYHDVPATMHGFDNALQAKITRNCVDSRIKFMQALLER